MNYDFGFTVSKIKYHKYTKKMKLKANFGLEWNEMKLLFRENEKVLMRKADIKMFISNCQ